MARLIRLVKPLSGYMVLAILMGLVGHLCAAFITIFGGFAVLDLLGQNGGIKTGTVFVCVGVFAQKFLRQRNVGIKNFHLLWG